MSDHPLHFLPQGDPLLKMGKWLYLTLWWHNIAQQNTRAIPNESYHFGGHYLWTTSYDRSYRSYRSYLPFKFSSSNNHTEKKGHRTLGVSSQTSNICKCFRVICNKTTSPNPSVRSTTFLLEEKIHAASSTSSFSGGWFQPIWKIFVKMGIFPK